MVSWFYPRRVIGRTRYVLQNFPPSTHPKAYSRPVEVYERWLRNVARLNLAIVIAGLLIIGLILGTFVGGWDGWVVASLRGKDLATFIVAPFFVLQMITAVMYVDLSASKFLLAMKNMPPPRVRTAELHRRRLFDFVSPGMLIVAALTNVAFIAFILSSYQRLELPWFKVVASICGVVLTLLAYSVSVGVALRAPKVDPFQAHQDRHNVIKLVVQQGLTYCIAFPLLLAVVLTIKASEPVMTSLFAQGIALASLWHSYRYRVDKVDFDVYRPDAQGSTPDGSARISSP